MAGPWTPRGQKRDADFLRRVIDAPVTRPAFGRRKRRRIPMWVLVAGAALAGFVGTLGVTTGLRQPSVISEAGLPAVSYPGDAARSSSVQREAAAGDTSNGWPAEVMARHRAAARNCNAARAVGLAPARRGEPGYYPQHDRDNDGIACEPWVAR